EVNPNSIWTLMNVSFRMINKTNPNLTTECWLCFNAKPPYYEAIGLGNRPRLANGSNPGSCRWENSTQGISLQHVQGQGRCVG
ncbi:UNVERIFIED_CONTAM: MLV-related proviral Env polyprotein, partial [Eudyptes pachyrhynchus]